MSYKRRNNFQVDRFSGKLLNDELDRVGSAFSEISEFDKLEILTLLTARNITLSGTLNGTGNVIDHQLVGRFNLKRYQGQTVDLLRIISEAGTVLFKVDKDGNCTFAGLTLSGHLLFSPDNTYDIGASGATRPRDLFLARNAVVGGTGTFGSGSGAIALVASDASAGFWIRNDTANIVFSSKVGDIYYGLNGRVGLQHVFEGNLIWNTDNAFDIGASGANRPRHIYASGNLIIGGTATVNTAGGNISWGTYTPTRSAETNMDANVTMTQAQYMRVGNTVTVSGRFTADPTLTATATSFEITLPVASNIGAVEDAAGTAFCGAIAAQGAEIIGVVANDTAKVQWVAGDVTSQVWSYTFTYRIV